MIVIIPARLESTRLPFKMLLEVDGKPLIKKVVDDIRSLGYKTFVATDNDKIAKAVGLGVIKTDHYPNGTLRAMAAAKTLGEDKFILVQGDCLGVSKETLDKIQDKMQQDDWDAVTCVTKFKNESDRKLKSKVKSIHDGNRIIWNTRHNLEYCDHHVGVYGFNNMEIGNKCVGDTFEDLEHNEWIMKGFNVGCVEIDDPIIDINTQDDYKKLTL